MEFVAELVAFLIILFVLWKYVLPLITKMVSDRQTTVQRQVDEAEKATRELNAANAKLDASVEQARQEAARIRDDARADATSIKEELVEQAREEVERIKQRGQEQLVAQRDQVVRGLRSQVGGTSMQLAERVVHEQLSDDDARSATIDGFLSEIDDLTPPRGSQQGAATIGGTS